VEELENIERCSEKSFANEREGNNVQEDAA
jgi:hypothetical protein